MNLSPPTLSQAGVSLVEMIVAIGCGTMLIALGLGIHSDLLIKHREFESRLQISSDLLAVTSYLSREFQQAGGGPIRPFQAIRLENNCGPLAGLPDCFESDRLTLITTRADFPGCLVSRSLGAGRLEIENSGGICCLQLVPDGSFMFLNLNGIGFQKRIASIDSGLCTLTFTAGQADRNAVDPLDWAGASMTIVDVKTYFLDMATFELNTFVDLNGNLSADNGEINAVAQRIFDFQVAFGVDFQPSDGSVTSLPDRTVDEWLYNTRVVGLNEAMGVNFFASARPENIRLAQLTLIGGSPINSVETGPITAMDGPNRQRANWQLKRASVTNFPRNVYEFK